MRGPRAFVVLTVYLLLLTCLAVLVYYASVVGSSGPAAQPRLASVGAAIFGAVFLTELFLVAFITPAFTVGAITGERDQMTYELLRATLLSTRQVVSGKLTAALTYVGLLILSAIPLEGLAFMLGGAVIEELLVAQLVLAVTAVAFGALGLFFSSLAPTTLTSTVLTYAVALMTVVGLPLIIFLLLGLLGGPILSGYGAPDLPFVVRAVLFYGAYVVASASPVVAAIISKVVLVEEGALWFFRLDLAGATALSGRREIVVPSGWIVCSVLYLGLAAVLLLWTAMRLQRQETE
jgi:ABC-type transport system involved in multi-copper enzyme maturation permease subunit